RSPQFLSPQPLHASALQAPLLPCPKPRSPFPCTQQRSPQATARLAQGTSLGGWARPSFEHQRPSPFVERTQSCSVAQLHCFPGLPPIPAFFTTGDVTALHLPDLRNACWAGAARASAGPHQSLDVRTRAIASASTSSCHFSYS